jgi:hypothetical protein
MGPLARLFDLFDPAAPNRATLFRGVATPDTLALIGLHSPAQTDVSNRASGANGLRLRYSGDVRFVRKERDLVCHFKTGRRLSPRCNYQIDH